MCPPDELFLGADAYDLPFAGNTGLAVADLDGDGDLDAVTSRSGSPPNGGGYNVFINNGDADPTVTTVVAAGPPTLDVALADLDGDGLTDLAMGMFVGGVEVRLGFGDGTFGPPVAYATGAFTLHIEAIDMNGDGLLDLLAVDRGSETLGVLIGVGDGTFLPAAMYSTGAWPLSFAAADLDLDGWIDIVVPNRNDDDVSIFMNQGDGTLDPAVNIAVGDQPGEVVSDDFNGDGFADLLVSTRDEASAVLLGEGDGTFTAGPPLIVPFGAGAVTVLDLNGDAYADLACYQNSSQEHSVAWTFTGQGDGTFTPAGAYQAMAFGVLIAAADWTGDDIDDLLMLSSGLRVVPGKGDGTLETLPATPTGGATAVVVDVNNDGILDLVGSQPNAQYLRVALGLGDGTFAPPLETPSPERVWYLAHGDLDGDGDVDLVSTNLNVTSKAVVFLGNGDGTFAIGATYSTYLAPAEVALADIDEDGALDLLVAHTGVAAVAIRIGNGDGTFGASEPIVAGYRELVVTDLDGDGHLDLAQTQDGGFVRRRGNGDGSFQPVETFDLPLDQLFYGSGLTATDVNADGRLDILTLGDVEDAFQVAVRLATTTGGYAAAETYATGQTLPDSGVRSLAVADFDGDGVPDVAAAASLGGRDPISVLHGLGDGSFGAPTLFGGGAFSNDMAAADLDANGTADLAVANLNDGAIMIMLNLCPGAPGCPADLDGSGAVDGADVGQLLGAWGTPGPGDVSGDGIVDGADLGILLGSWGPCE